MATHLDYETTSACDITLGSYRYASHPSTRVLMFAAATDDGEPLLWRFDDPYSDESLAAEALLRASIAAEDLIYAHNAQFEVAVSTYRMRADLGVQPPTLEQWRCTQAMCKRAAAPESLAAAAEFFGLGDKKNPVGKELIKIFSDQSVTVTLQPPAGMIDPGTITRLKNGNFSKGKKPKAWKTVSPVLDGEIKWDWLVKVGGEMITVRAAWEMFCGYCKQDVRVEQELHRKLARFELTGDVLESFQFDLRMNWRGVPVNVAALHNALGIVDGFKQKLGARFTRMCGFEPGQRDRTLEWLRARGYPEEDLQAGTVEKILEAPPEGMSPLAVEVLRTRSLLSFAALAKIPKMIDAACDDGRVRGTTQWHAARTGRAGGRIIQPQNFKKSTIDDSELCYKMIRENWEPIWFEEFWSSPLEAIASSIRHFIHPHEGEFFDADYTGVEARITPWLAGDAAKLDIILQGLDLYKRMATIVFNVPYDEVTKDQRTICKPIELGCCFGVGGKALKDALAAPPYNVERTRPECVEYVRLYRQNHPETVQAWKDIEDAAKAAVQQPGVAFTACGKKLGFICGRIAGIPYLAMQLPSKRRLYYPHPKVKATFKAYDEEDMVEDAWKREKGGYWIDQLSFYGKLRESNHWGRVGTWGSRLFENAVQAIGADLLNRGCIEAERRGFNIAMIVHDQALAETKDAPGDLEDFIDALCTKDPWAASFPLAASGAVQPFYLKD
jgi:DNA polymerase bacteriophage-type